MNYLDILQPKFKNKDILPTVLKWSIIAPFDYVLKQIHKQWMKWLYPYGWANTGKINTRRKNYVTVFGIDIKIMMLKYLTLQQTHQLDWGNL